jgi:hypothetical protein
MRVADGREVYGRSVDWFAAAAESIDPLISHTLVERGGMSTVVKDSLPQEGSPKEAALSQSVGVSGVWEWAANSSLDSSVSEVPNGLLIIGETDGGGISVNSMLLNTTQEISTSENLMLVSLVDMTGSVTLNNGTPELAFSSSPDLQGVSVRSKATMVDNGARLTGFSEAVITGTDGNTKTIRYEWSARRK